MDLGRQTAIEKQLVVSVPKFCCIPCSLPVLKGISIRYSQLKKRRLNLVGLFMGIQ